MSLNVTSRVTSTPPPKGEKSDAAKMKSISSTCTPAQGPAPSNEAPASSAGAAGAALSTSMLSPLKNVSLAAE